jgi:NAD(P)-dependent dehydrogenase (short-subunit alcohol dehydrogenase family)
MAQAQRVAVVTGASSGIGKETARALVAQGWHVIGIGRNADRTAEAEEELRGSVAHGGKLDMIRADLALMAEAVRTADEITLLTDRVDVLVNNAGGMAKAMVVTPEGLEANFASNHLGPFLLTDRLLPLLKRAAADGPKGSVRIINTSSDASEMIPGFDWDDLQGMKRFNGGASYCRGKLANVMFARGLAKRLADDGIVAHAMHPGMVDSNFASHADEQAQETMRKMADQARTPVQGADTIVWLATAEEPGQCSGGYYFERKPRKPNPLVDDEEAVERLWSESEILLTEAGF